MRKLKLFLSNFFVYGVGGVISRIIPLIMVPIVAKIMPSTDYFGISDISGTVVSFGSAIAIMGMYDSMYRLFFEKDDDYYKKRVCSTALCFTAVTSIIVFLLMILFSTQISRLFLGEDKYYYIICISAVATLVSATNSLVCAPTRMQNQRNIFLITNTAGPVISYAISIPLLLNGYYIIALPLAAVISGVTMEVVFVVLNKKWFNPKLFDAGLLKQLLIIAIPLLPNFLIYWVFNSCDKVMITNLIGLGEAGVYSVGSKLGHTSQLVYTAFVGGWQFFAFSTMKEENQVESNSRIFEYLGVISFISTAFICAVSYFIFELLFDSKYINGYIVAPYLFMAPLLQMIFQVAANQFLVIKKTWPNFIILFAGALINVVINYYLIPVLGIEGASIATLIGYVISNLICVFVLNQMKLMKIRKRFWIVTFFMMVYFLIWRFCFSSNMLFSLILSIIFVFIVLFFYKNDVILLLKTIKNDKQEGKE